MNTKTRIPWFLVGVCAFISAGCKNEEANPNIIFILADDLGWAQTGVYGSDYYKTPNIDHLAAEGIRFTNAYAACSVSSPTRASIMTGKYPARLHLTDFIAGNPGNDYPLSQPDWQKSLPLEEVTLAEVIGDQGYNTAIFGKWHLSVTKFGPESLPFNPDKQGFKEHFVSDKPDRNDNPEKDAHKSDSIGNTSVRFIKENAGDPFFLFVSFSAIHNPLMEKADSIDKWKNVAGSGKPENNPIIAAMLSTMDRNIGKIMNAVDECGLGSNTIIIFFSDNGGLETEAKQTPLRHGKGWLYEGGIREPLIIKWPGVTEGGSVSREIVTSVDFMPTICELLNVKNRP
jgi:arylsulfatase A-like enzyme